MPKRMWPTCGRVGNAVHMSRCRGALSYPSNDAQGAERLVTGAKVGSAAYISVRRKRRALIALAAAWAHMSSADPRHPRPSSSFDAATPPGDQDGYGAHSRISVFCRSFGGILRRVLARTARTYWNEYRSSRPRPVCSADLLGVAAGCQLSVSDARRRCVPRLSG
jgi:hypothetical protein